MTATCLIIVDVQQGFINRWTEHVPDRVTRLQRHFDIVFASRFANPPGSPYRRLIHWERFAPGSPDTELAFVPRADARLIDKTVYTCVTPALLAGLRAAGAETVHLAGIATDNCVLKTAADLFESGMTPQVIVEACASHGGPDAHEAGLLVLRRMIGQDNVLVGAASFGSWH